MEGEWWRKRLFDDEWIDWSEGENGKEVMIFWMVVVVISMS